MFFFPLLLHERLAQKKGIDSLYTGEAVNVAIQKMLSNAQNVLGEKS